jgi:gamma-glutamylputrescine oxidase
MQSYWQREAGWRDRWHDTSLPAHADFVVIGGGFAGLATAIRIREREADASIVVLEAERVGSGASGRSAGFLSPLAAPVWLLGAERSTDHAWAAAKINEEVHEIASWLERAGDIELARVRLGLAAGDRLGEAALGEFVNRVSLVGLAHQVLPSRAREGHRFLAMDAYTLHPYKLAVGLAEYATHQGIAIREHARVTKLDGTRVTFEGGVLDASCIVLCTNAYTSLAPVRAAVVHSFMTATEPLDDVSSRRLVRDTEFTVEVNAAQAYHRMHAGRVIYGGVDKLWSPDDEVPADVVSRLAKHMKASFPGTLVAPGETWTGRFHATTNGLPIIRRDGNRVLNVGYGGTGVALALTCAKRAAALACGEPDDRLMSIIRSTRIGVRDSIRALAQIAGRISAPWR